MDPGRNNTQRAERMRIFALSRWQDLADVTKDIAATTHRIVRGPEIGMLMLRGRMGSTGGAFNFGEATITRCSVRLNDGTEGHSYVLGRNPDHARRAALLDAVFESCQSSNSVAKIVSELETLIAQRHQQTSAKAAATKVDFLTMVRGDV